MNIKLFRICWNSDIAESGCQLKAQGWSSSSGAEEVSEEVKTAVDVAVEVQTVVVAEESVVVDRGCGGQSSYG